MSEVELCTEEVVLQEFSHGPSLMALANSHSRIVRNEKDNQIYCVEEESHKKVYFWVISLFKVVERTGKKGSLVKAVEVCVIRCEDFKIGILVFIEGHRHATFIEKVMV